MELTFGTGQGLQRVVELRDDDDDDPDSTNNVLAGNIYISDIFCLQFSTTVDKQNLISQAI